MDLSYLPPSPVISSSAQRLYSQTLQPKAKHHWPSGSALHKPQELALMLMVWLHFCSWLSHNDQDVLAQATKSGTMWPSQVEGEEDDFTSQAAVIPLKYSSTWKDLHLLKLIM